MNVIYEAIKDIKDFCNKYKINADNNYSVKLENESSISLYHACGSWSILLPHSGNLIEVKVVDEDAFLDVPANYFEQPNTWDELADKSDIDELIRLTGIKLLNVPKKKACKCNKTADKNKFSEHIKEYWEDFNKNTTATSKDNKPKTASKSEISKEDIEALRELISLYKELQKSAEESFERNPFIKIYGFNPFMR